MIQLVFLADLESAKQLLKVLKDFEKCSGLKCNNDKTTARWIGANKFSPDGDLPVLWCRDHFTLLGITFHEDEKRMFKLNSDSKLTSFKEILKVWRVRNLPLIGKNVVLKSLAISKLLFMCSLIHVDESLVKEVQACIGNFIWNDR